MFGLASIVGPLLGGYLTAVTWRWCFWINLPLGGISLVVLVWAAPRSPALLPPAKTLLGRINQLDPVGFALVAPATVCLLFALQWGGTKYPWSDDRIIVLFVLSGVLSLVFVAAQIWRKDEATVPPRIFLQRSVFFSTIGSAGIGSILVLYAFYLPIWFQAIQGKTPQSSGLSLLPLLLSNVLVVGCCSATVMITGYYTPFMIVGGALCVVSAGLISTWQVNASAGVWIGYQVRLGRRDHSFGLSITHMLQVLAGGSLGLVFQQPNIAVQTVLSKEDVPIGVSLLSFTQFLAGTIFVTISQTVLENKLASGLSGRIPGFDPSVIAGQGATSIRDLVPSAQLGIVLQVYNESLQAIWYITLGLSGLIFLSSFGLEWRSVEQSRQQGQNES